MPTLAHRPQSPSAVRAPADSRQAHRRYRGALLLGAIALLVTPWAQAQNDPVPGRFATILTSTDLPGNDLQMSVGVTLERCQATCLRNGECAAFTFNERAGACFLKGSVGEAVHFEGATSGVIGNHTPALVEGARAAAAEMTFLTEDDLRGAREQAAALPAKHPAGERSENDLLIAAGEVSAARAVPLTAAAVTVADSGRAWLAYARALLWQAEIDDKQKYSLSLRATPASINAALRLTGAARAEALTVMASALEGVHRGEDALKALEAADRLSPGVAGEDLARLKDAFGFRILSSDVDARTAAPRICVAFSQELQAGLDYAPYVTSLGAPLALEVEGQRLCLSGVKYGESYALKVRAGLPSAEGDTLPKDAELEVYVRDRAPMVRFPGSAYVLPAKGPRALPVETVNAEHLDLKLLRVSERNLASIIRAGDFLEAMGVWAANRFEDQQTEEVWSGAVELMGELNRATTSRIPLSEVGELPPGVYVLRADINGADSQTAPPAMQWFLISDLGVTTLAGADGVHVVVQRLSDGQPVNGARVSLVARSNRVLGEAVTSSAGAALFPAALAGGSGNAAPALVLVEAKNDLTLLSLLGSEFDLSDRGVTGRSASGPIDAFVTTDRGVYRPGETVHVTALLRNDRADALTGLPLTLSLLRPDGVEYERRVIEDQAGGYVTDVPLGANAARGVWRIELFVDPKAPALASYALLVEEFIPERIGVETGLTSSGPINPALPPTLTVDAHYLFGAPAAGLAVTGSVSVSPSATLEGWEGYSFGRVDQWEGAQRFQLPPGLATDGAGRAAAPLPLGRLVLEPRPYEATVVTTVTEASSRPVERTLTRAVRPPGNVVGVRSTGGGALPENAEAEFELVIVNPEGELVRGDLEWRVDRIQTRYQWYAVGGSWYWEPITERERVDEGSVSVSGAPARISVPLTWGQYELRATQVGAEVSGAPPGASLEFTAGWVPADAARETPDLLEVSLNAATYRPGDTALLRVEPEEPGVALVTVLAERVIDLRLVEVTGATTIELPVTEEWGAGAYVTASLVHPSGGPEHVPSRSLGLAYAGVDPGERALRVEVSAPTESRSGRSVTVGIQVPELAGTTTPAYATLAAVDVGALNITGFKSPDPVGHYFGQRRLGVAIRDLYGRLIDARQGAMGDVRSGGGTEVEVAAGPAPAEEVVALFKGPIELVDGRAEAVLELPPFDGTLRLMAVVWTEEAVGQASEELLVRDPVVIQGSLPRFLTPGDESRLRLELTLVKGTPGGARLTVEGHGVSGAPRSVTLPRESPVVVEVPLTPTEAGEHTYRVSLTTPDGEVIERQLQLSVLYTDPAITTSSLVELDPGESVSLGSEVLAGFRPGTGRATLSAASGGAIDLPGLLLRLEGPGYGSTERLASGLLALLLTPELQVQLGLVDSNELVERAQEMVDSLLARQASDGSFGFWSPGSFDLWLSAYVTDVLLTAEASEALPLSVPSAALRSALDNLRNNVAFAGALRGDAPPYAYAFYVLARAGEAAVGDLRYYADTLADAFDTPFAAAHLGAALALYGDNTRAERMFERASDLARTGEGSLAWRADYGTTLRDRAGVLALAAEARPNLSALVNSAHLAAQVAGGRRAARLSSQEAAWELRAAVALGAAPPNLEVNGSPVTGQLAQRLDGAETTLSNVGAETLLLTVTAVGVPVAPPPASGEGYEISRSLYTLEGDPADLSSVRVGDRFAVVIDVRPNPGVPGGRLLVNDALPAAFELDNANLLRSGDVRELDWLQLDDPATFMEVFTEARAERFLAAVNQVEAEPFRLAYIVRAVSPGEFHYPAPLVEDLYRPQNRAVGETGRLTVGE